MEFFHTALELRKKITELLMRDFGLKQFKRDIKYVGEMEEFNGEEREIIQEIFAKYDLDKEFTDEYPRWLLEKERNYFMDILRDLIKNLVHANSIYPVNMNEYYVRRNYQNKAIGNCEDLLQEMQYIIALFPVNVEKYMPYVETIEREIALVKGWRKSDNKIAKRIMEESNNNNNKDNKN